MSVDLHIHTTCSDGTCSIDQIIKICVKKKIDVISITDHNCIDAYKQLSDEDANHIDIITGIEFSTQGQYDLHILGYGLDLKNTKLNKYLYNYRVQEAYKYRKLLRKIQKEGTIRDLPSLEECYSRHKLAGILVKKNVCKSIEEACQTVLNYKVAQSNKIDSTECINLIHECNGIAVLAHPGKYEKQGINIKNLLVYLASVGLDGIECYSPENDFEQTQCFLKLASQLNLIVTGGSDYHGLSKPKVLLGEVNNNRINKKSISSFLEKITHCK